MSFWILCLLCIVQGLAEFLPISSSGHLLLVEQLFKVEGDLMMLNLFLHVATLCAVVVVYRKIIWNLLKKPLQPLTYKLVLSTAITVVMALAYEYFDLDKYGFKVYGFCFLITSIVLFVTFMFQKKSTGIPTQEISTKSAVVVGFVQGLAVLPGISRSGSTISSLILCGNDENKASEYSFLLSIPVIVGGFALELIKLIRDGGSGNAFASVGAWECMFAFILTFVVALASLKITLKLLKNNKFIYFSIYLLLIGLFVVGYNFIF